MPRVPLKKEKSKIILHSARNISIYAQSTCHTLYHVSKYTQSNGGGGFSGFYFLRGRNPNRKFHSGVNRK